MSTSQDLFATFRIIVHQIEGLDPQKSNGKKHFVAWELLDGSGAGKSARLRCQDGVILTPFPTIEFTAAVPESESLSSSSSSSSRKKKSSRRQSTTPGRTVYEPIEVQLTVKRLEKDRSSSAEGTNNDGDDGSLNSSLQDSNPKKAKQKLRAVTSGRVKIDVAPYLIKPSSEQQQLAFGKEQQASLSLSIEATLGASEGAASGKKPRKRRTRKSRRKKGDDDDDESIGTEGDDFDNEQTEDFSESSFVDTSVAGDDETTVGDFSDEDFGSELGEDVFAAEDRHSQSTTAPVIIQDMIELLSQSTPLEVRGLIQLAADPSVVQTVGEMYKQGVAVPSEWTEYPVVINVLKTVLSQRPSALLACDVADRMATVLKDSSEERDRVQKYRPLVSTANEQGPLLNMVTELLWKLALSPNNNVSARNCATAFIEGYWRPPTASVSELRDKFEQLSSAIDVIEFLVLHYDRLFTPTQRVGHAMPRMTPSQFVQQSLREVSAESDRAKKKNRRLSAVFSAPIKGKKASGKPTLYDFTLNFKAIHDLADFASSNRPNHLFLRWKRGKKSKNHGFTPRVDLTADAATTHRIVFPANTATHFKVSLFKGSKGLFFPKAIAFELVYDKDGKTISSMPGGLDLAEQLNVLAASGSSSLAALSTELVIPFTSLAGTTKLLVAVRASEHHKASSKHSTTTPASSSSSSSSLSSSTSLNLGASSSSGGFLEPQSPRDNNLYIMLANTIASHQHDEVYLQDWMTVLHPRKSVEEKRWCAVTKESLILFQAPEPGVAPSPTDPRDMFDMAAVTEIKYGRNDFEFALGTSLGLLTMSVDARPKRDQWVSELRRLILLVKQEAGNVLKMSAQEARRTIDTLTSELQRAREQLAEYERELAGQREQIRVYETVELPRLRGLVKTPAPSLGHEDVPRWQMENARLDQQLQEQQARNAELDAELSAARTQAKQARAEVAELKLQLGSKQGTVVEELTRKLDELRSRYDTDMQSMQAQLDTATAGGSGTKVDKLKQQHAAALMAMESKYSLQIKELAQERDTATQQLAELESLRAEVAHLKKKGHKARRRSEAATDSAAALQAQAEIRKLFFAEHAWDEHLHLLDAKRLYQLIADADAFAADNRTLHQLLETIVEDLVDVTAKNHNNPGLVLFYASFTLTLLDLLQEESSQPRVSDIGLLSSPTASASSSVGGEFAVRKLRDGDDVLSWLVEQLLSIAKHLIYVFYIPHVYGPLDEVAVVSLLFSEQYAIFEAFRTSRSPGEEIVHYLADVAAQLEQNRLFRVLAEDVLRHIFFRIDSHVFNTLIESDKTDVVTSRRGFQIKMGLSEIDSWVGSHASSSCVVTSAIATIARSQLQFIRAACTLIVTATNESMFSTPDTIRDLFAPLSARQIHRLLTQYRADPSCPARIPTRILQVVSELGRTEPADSLLLPKTIQKR